MGKRGFTLLEMIVATTIMGIAVVGLLAAISGSVRNASKLREYGRAVQLARLQMNELLVNQRFPRNVPVQGGFDRSMSGGLDAGWQARLTTFEMPPAPAPGQIALDRIELEVWWTAGSQKRTFFLESYRPRTLTALDLVPVGAP